MKITDNIKIVKAEYVKDYIIRFTFNDGKVNNVNFYNFLNKPAQNPMTSKYLNVVKFQKFKIIGQEIISWNDYEMCYDINDLYKGKIISEPITSLRH